MKKGITPIIAIVLLLMMTVAAAGAAYVWITTMQGRIQRGASSEVGEMGQEGQVSVEGVKCDANGTNDDGGTSKISNTTVYMWLKDTGDTTIPDGTSTLTITDSSTGTTIDVLNQTTGSLTPNQVRKINFTDSDYLMEAGKNYGLTVSLPDGTSASDACTAENETVS